MTDTDGPNIQSVTLERMKLVAVEYITDELAEQFAVPAKVELSMLGKWSCDEIVLRVVQEVYGWRGEAKVVRYPADWWQAFKNHWFPTWALQRWPVEYHTERLEAWEVYPKLSVPGYEPKIIIRKRDEGRGLENENQ